jgi:two-component system nitrogen regulation response regulator GlnG
MSRAPRVLVADDEPSIRFVLREALEEQGCEVVAVEDGDAALEALAGGGFELAFLDIRMPGASGLDILDRLREQQSDTAAVIITAQNTFENAVEAMKRGALDYLVKPFELREVAALLEKALRARELQREVERLRREAGRRAGSPARWVGRSAALLEIFKTVGRVAARDVPVLITGESGSGKEVVARAIHAASPRSAGPFIAVNTAAIPRELLESELFGHERGAFTGAVSARAGRFREAARGTIFLDEIGDMSMDLQAKLLRVLQDSEVTPVGGSAPEAIDVRVLAATHRDLDAGVAEGRFREDLLYRLRVVPLHVPPLRERREDVGALAEHFVARYAETLTGAPRYLAGDTIALLERQRWPGNVRELENAIRRALVLGAGEVLTPQDFEFLEQAAAPAQGGFSQQLRAEIEKAIEAGGDDVYRHLLERVERPLIEAALLRTDGNQIRAARVLGINRNTLRKKIADLGISVPGRG